MEVKHNVLFIGIDSNVFHILKNDQRVELVGANIIEDFLTYKTSNLADYFFKWAYQLHIINQFSIFKKLLLFFAKVFKNYSSDVYQQFLPYLESLIKSNIPVIDLDDSRVVRAFTKQNNIDVFAMSNWWMLTEEIINIPKFKIVNIHPSPLPKYRGSLPTLWSLKNKDKKTAVSFMVIDASMDGGKLIGQHAVDIEPTDDALSLEEKCDAVIRENFVTDLIGYLDGKIIPKAQDQSKASVTEKYFPYMKIDWQNEKAKDIVDKILLYPHLWPPDKCYSIFENEKIHFRRASFDKSLDSLAKPGQFIIQEDTIRIRATDGVVVAKLDKDINRQESLKLRSTKKIEMS